MKITFDYENNKVLQNNDTLLGVKANILSVS